MNLPGACGETSTPAPQIRTNLNQPTENQQHNSRAFPGFELAVNADIVELSRRWG